MSLFDCTSFENELDDADSVTRAAISGDVRAASELVRRVAPKVSGVVKAVMGANDTDVDDVVQQSLVAFVHALPAFRGECEPTSYAGRIAARTAIAARKRARVIGARAGASLEDEAVQVASPEPGPQETAAAARRRAVMHELLESIPEEQAEAFCLRTVLGWTLEEIARAAGVPINTVRSRMRLAKEALRKKIEADPKLGEALGL